MKIVMYWGPYCGRPVHGNPNVGLGILEVGLQDASFKLGIQWCSY